MRTRQRKIELKTKDLFYFLLKYMIHNMLVSGVQQKDSEHVCVCVWGESGKERKDMRDLIQ